jgi:hypothetical protein
MAGNENSGGPRPSAPQNNPANISATGGAGGSGQQQPLRYISGGTYGQGQELMNQQKGAAMAQAPSPTVAAAQPLASNLPQATPLTAPSERPDEPVTTGIAMGPGAGPEALMLPQPGDTTEDKQRMLSYLPVLESAALSPNSSQAFRNYVRVLRANLQ